MDFAEWAELVSQRTNRSLAGAAIYLKKGLSEEELPAPSVLGAWGLHEAGSADDAGFIYPEVPDEPAEYAADEKEINSAIDQALKEMNEQGIKGKFVTPFLLARVKDITGGDSLDANIHLVYNNAQLAAKTAVAYSKLH